MHTRRGGWWWLILVGCGEFGGFGEFVVFGGTHTHTDRDQERNRANVEGGRVVEFTRDQWVGRRGRRFSDKMGSRDTRR